MNTTSSLDAGGLIERSKYVFHSYDMGQNNANDRQLLRDCIAFLKATQKPIVATAEFRDHAGLPGGTFDYPTTPSPAVDEEGAREVIARVIDPDAWREDWGWYFDYEHERDAAQTKALAKADAILKSFASLRSPVDECQGLGAPVPDRAGGPADPSPAVSAKGAHPSRRGES